MRRVSLCLLSAFALTAQAQDAEFGARYWYSQATTTRSHNAQGLVPFLGNPTSVLTYEDLNAHAVELHGRKSFGEGWFIKGNAGLGSITRGSFDDEDFFAGQVKFSDTGCAKLPMIWGRRPTSSSKAGVRACSSIWSCATCSRAPGRWGPACATGGCARAAAPARLWAQACR